MVEYRDETEHPGGAQETRPTWGSPAPDAPVPGTEPGPDPRARTRNPWKLWQKAAAGATLAAVVGVGGVAAVSAANASSGAGTAGVSGGSGHAADGYGSDGYGSGGYGSGRYGDPGTMAGGDRADFGGARGAMALADALHGDFVVQTDGTATETRRLQNGSVTAVASGSLTVSSSDGYIGSYTVPTDLDVSGVAVGDEVQVLATVDGDTVTAISVRSEGAEGLDGPGDRELPDMPEGVTPPSAPESAPQTS